MKTNFIVKIAKSKFKNAFFSFDCCICGSSIISRFCNIPVFWLPVIQIVHAFVDGQLIFGSDRTKKGKQTDTDKKSPKSHHLVSDHVPYEFHTRPLNL